MPLVGNLTEFPLPEVLLLIGSRTGRLRLYDAPDIVSIEMDLSEGHAHGLHIGESFLTETSQIVAELSFLIETGEGMFEFLAQPIVSVRHDRSLPINELVMLLVLHVDEKLAKQNAVSAELVDEKNGDRNGHQQTPCDEQRLASFTHASAGLFFLDHKRAPGR